MRVTRRLKVSTSVAENAARLRRAKYPSNLVASPATSSSRKHLKLEQTCLACFRRSTDRGPQEDEILPKTCTAREMSLSVESFQNSARGEQLRNRWERLPDLEGGTSIILIPRETFRLAETRIGLPLFEVDEGTPPISPEGWSAPGMEGCRNAGWCITNLVSPGAQNGRREACSRISAPQRC
jgi:hypothetical protein